jgi:hypothetical protein
MFSGSVQIALQKGLRGLKLLPMATAKSESTIIDVKVAAESAMNYFRRLFPNVRSFSLEEVELSDDEKYWSITLGYDVAANRPLIPAELLPPTTKYKVFKVDAATGKVLSMKIRSLR